VKGHIVVTVAAGLSGHTCATGYAATAALSQKQGVPVSAEAILMTCTPGEGRTALVELPGAVERVSHLAARAGVRASWGSDSHGDTQINVLGAQVVLKVFNTRGTASPSWLARASIRTSPTVAGGTQSVCTSSVCTDRDIGWTCR
jgi:hypothetical protein